MARRNALALLTVSTVAATMLAGGCSIIGSGVGGPGTSHPGGDTLPTDEQDYLALQHQLEVGRSQFLDKSAQELETHGNRLFWKTYPSFDPVLHSRTADGAAIDYDFSIGSGDLVNYRASAQLLVTALPDGDTVRYFAYDPTRAMAPLGELDLPAPGDEQRWWAYATSGSALYVVTTGDETTLLRWQPGEQGAKTLTTLESAGAEVGEFLDFDVQGDTMVFIESGRLWKLGLAANHATWLENQTEIAGAVSFDPQGVTFEDSTGLEMFDYGTGSLRDLSAEIAANAWAINDTYKSADRFYSAATGNNFARYGSWVVYTANSGIFAYDVVHKMVSPVLLTPIDLMDGARVEYRYPVVMDDGNCFVVGLQSDDGAVGADGPVYRVSLAAMLK